MMNQDKAEAQLAARLKVWNEVVDSRRWQVRQIYGHDAAERFTGTVTVEGYPRPDWYDTPQCGCMAGFKTFNTKEK